jgi:hypothetical protein
LRVPGENRKKTAHFFRGFPGDFPGDFPGISRGLFSEKTRIFPDFHPVLSACTLLHSARSGKTPEVPEKFPEISRIPGNLRKKFPEITGNSVRWIFGEIFPDFPGFSSRFRDVYPVPQRAFWEKPPNFRKSSRGFLEFPGIPGKNFPKFPEIPSDRFRGKFSEFSEFLVTPEKMEGITCARHCKNST